MFKAKIKKNNIVYIKYLSTLASIFLLINNISYAGSISLDGLLQNISQLGTQTHRESSSSNSSQKDLFFQTQKNIETNTNNSLLQSINNTLQSIQTNAAKNRILSCNIKKSDIITILGSSIGFIEETTRQGNIPLGTIVKESGNIQKSCENFLHCSNILSSTQSITTRKEIEDCTTSVYKQYNINKTLKSDMLNLPEKNNNDNIYLDGIKDNALFDLMLDISIIKDILFNKDNGQKTPQMIYYSLPSVSAPTKNTNTTPGNISAIGGTNNNIQNNNIKNIGAGVTIGGVETTANINGLNTISQFIDSVKANETSNKIDINPKTIVQTASCPIPTETEITDNDNTSESNTTQTNQDIINNFYQTQDALLEALSGFLYTPDNIGKVGGNTNNGNANIIKTDNALPPTTQACQSSCNNIKGEFEKMTCEGNCCINQCNNIDSGDSDKLICISQCLCGDISTANDMLRVKICRVPVQTARVLAGKKINSIEEVVDEINQIFNKLKQNGLLTKRSKKQEFMDSSFSDIKFHEIFAFDVFIAIKPIYDKLQLKQKTETTQKNHKNIKNSNIFISGKLGQGRDKNKYMIIGGKTTDENMERSCTNMGLSYDREQKKCDTKKIEDISSNILDQLSRLNTPSIINDKFYQFSQEHYKLRDQIYKQITDIQTIAEILKTKAQNAQ